jgi:hypothetical protein
MIAGQGYLKNKTFITEFDKVLAEGLHFGFEVLRKMPDTCSL